MCGYSGDGEGVPDRGRGASGSGEGENGLAVNKPERIGFCPGSPRLKAPRPRRDNDRIQTDQINVQSLSHRQHHPELIPPQLTKPEPPDRVDYPSLRL